MASAPTVFEAPLGAGETASAFNAALASERRRKGHWSMPVSLGGKPQDPRHPGTILHDPGVCTICSGTHPGKGGWKTGVVAPGTPLRAAAVVGERCKLCSTCTKEIYAVRHEVTGRSKVANAPPPPPSSRSSRFSIVAAAAAPATRTDTALSSEARSSQTPTTFPL